VSVSFPLRLPWKPGAGDGGHLTRAHARRMNSTVYLFKPPWRNCVCVCVYFIWECVCVLPVCMCHSLDTPLSRARTVLEFRSCVCVCVCVCVCEISPTRDLSTVHMCV